MGWRLVLLLAASLTARVATAEPYRFDVAEDYLAPAQAWPLWRETAAAFSAEFETIAHCTDPSIECSSSFRGVNRLLMRLRDVEPDDRVRAVNAWVNRRRYREDRSRTTPDGRLPNEWRTLSDLVRRGGDCEDFAAAKYFLLRETGIPAERLRIVIAWDRPTRSYHAVLAYDTDDGVWLVETDGTIARRGQHSKYRFLFSISENGVWDHAPAEGATARHTQRQPS